MSQPEKHEQQTRGGSRIARACLELASILAPGMALLVLAMVGWRWQFLAPGVVGAIPGLFCLVSLGAGLSPRPLPSALSRGLFRLAFMYLFALGHTLLIDDPPLAGIPPIYAIALSCIAAPPLVLSLALRLFRWRLVRGDSELRQAQLPDKQFGLGQLFLWMTLAATCLGIGTGLVSRFNQEPGWGGLGLAILLWASVLYGIPTGILFVVLAWLMLSERWIAARMIVASLLAIGFVGFTLYTWVGYTLATVGRNDDAYSTWIVMLAVGIPALLVLLAVRLLGWRMTRLKKGDAA